MSKKPRGVTRDSSDNVKTDAPGLVVSDKSYTHLSKSKIVDISTVGTYKQLYAWGFNAGGRPEGFWVGRGMEWLKETDKLNNPKFPSCCYLYDVKIKPKSVVTINNADDLRKFDAETPSYWLNFDYFDIEFIDKLTSNHVKWLKHETLDSDRLNRGSGSDLRDILLHNHVIFDNAASAKKHCKFYSFVEPERYKFKDWAAISAMYSGIVFNKFDPEDRGLMYWIWYQSLDIESGCIWDVSAIKSINLVYEKTVTGWVKTKKIK